MGKLQQKKYRENKALDEEENSDQSSTESVTQQKVVSTDTVQEQRVVLPSLAVSNPIPTTPMAP